MSLFTPKNVIVQGITGSHGQFHTKTMLEYGTNVIAGTSPNKAGIAIEGVPVYTTISEIKNDFSNIDASVIFVPAAHAKGAIMEAIDSEIPLIVCITEGIPIHDMLVIKNRLKSSHSALLGPNCPGFLTPGESKVGIIPASVTMKGSVAVVSRSGTLTYEAAASLTKYGIGQRTIVGIGGDPIKGLGFVECLKEFENDNAVDVIILIGEIGGAGELTAATFIKEQVIKPVFAYIAGHNAPVGVQLGHAGAILKSDSDTAAAKSAILKQAGAQVFNSVAELITAVKEYKSGDNQS